MVDGVRFDNYLKPQITPKMGRDCRNGPRLPLKSGDFSDGSRSWARQGSAVQLCGSPVPLKPGGFSYGRRPR